MLGFRPCSVASVARRGENKSKALHLVLEVDEIREY